MPMFLDYSSVSPVLSMSSVACLTLGMESSRNASFAWFLVSSSVSESVADFAHWRASSAAGASFCRVLPSSPRVSRPESSFTSWVWDCRRYFGQVKRGRNGVLEGRYLRANSQRAGGSFIVEKLVYTVLRPCVETL